MSVVPVKDKADFMNHLSTCDKLIVVDFYADWCGPCRMIAPKLAAMAAEFAEKAMVLKVNVDECEDIAAEKGVSAMPTFQAYRGGEKVGEVVGASEEKLKALFSL